VSDPATKEEYERLFAENYHIEGFGIGNVYLHCPCPFCSAPENIVYEMLQVEEAMSKGAICKECDRGWKAVFNRDRGSLSFEIIQTGGSDPPSYLPKMRRSL
jgi:hypothetical protein